MTASAVGRYSFGMGKKTEKQGKKGRSGVVVLIIVLVLAASCAALYFLAFDTLVFVTDSAYSQVIPAKDILSLRVHCLFRGVRLRVLRLPDSVFENPATFSAAVPGMKGSYVLLSPVASVQASRTLTEVSRILGSSVVAAIDADDSRDLFDITLVSDDAPAWEKAALALAVQLRPMSQNAALVYDSQTSFDVKDIIDGFDTGRLSVFYSDGSRRLFNSETASKLSELSVVVAMCPHLSGLADLVRDSGSVSWIVDYRFAPVVPKENLFGVIIPDLKAAADSLLEAGKGQNQILALEYRYEKR